VYPRGHEIEWEDWKRDQQRLDERCSPLPLRRNSGAFHAVEQLGGRDRRYRDSVIAACRDRGVEIQRSSLGSNQDRRVDQRPQEDLGVRP
jgi:hypothetical protein